MKSPDVLPELGSSGDCPGCDSSLVNGQGLYHCPQCGWSGTNHGTEYSEWVPPGRYAPVTGDEGV